MMINPLIFIWESQLRSINVVSEGSTRYIEFLFSSTVSRSNWKLTMLVFVEGGKPYPAKNPQSKDENQQETQPTYDVRSRIRTRTTLVGGERSHHCIISLLPLPCIHYLLPLWGGPSWNQLWQFAKMAHQGLGLRRQPTIGSSIVWKRIEK